MSLNDDVKEAIRIAIAGGTLPKRGRSNQTTLNLKQNPGRSSYVLLARADGSLTKAGEFFMVKIRRKLKQQANSITIPQLLKEDLTIIFERGMAKNL